MNLKEYQSAASRTMNKELDFRGQLTTLTLGVVGEVGEVLELIMLSEERRERVDRKELIDELGDVNWYIANLYSLFDLEWEESEIYNDSFLKEEAGGRERTAALASLQAARLADCVKKVVGQGHELNTDIIIHLHTLTISLKYIASLYALDSEVIRKENIKKLKKRYPNGFDSEKSINRN